MEDSEETARKKLARAMSLTSCQLNLLAVTLDKKTLSDRDIQRINTVTGLLKSSAQIYDTISARNGGSDQHETQQSYSIETIKNGIGLSPLKSGVTSILTEMLQTFENQSEKDEKKPETIYFDIKAPACRFSGRSKELVELHDRLQLPKNISKVTAVSGLGGIGKTELCRKYIATYRHHVSHIIWINAEREESMRENFERLAKDLLGIKTKDANGGEKHISSIVDEVYRSLFSNSDPCLMVFDNAMNTESLHKYLPMYLSLTSENRPFVLITSRDNDWPIWANVIRLNEMHTDDAIDFVQRALSPDTIEVDEMAGLVKMLQCFPLALQQATSYITKRKERNPSYNITSYLQTYNANKKELLDSSIFFDMFNDYKQTTFSTWNVTIKVIAADEEYGDLSIQILNCLAYFAAENIPAKIFNNLSNGSSDVIDDALQLLLKYSMVKEDQNRAGVLSIHRLVQEVIKIKLRDELKEEKVITTCLELLAFDEKTDTLEHIMSVWAHVVNYKNLVKKYTYLPTRLIEYLVEQGKYNASHGFSIESKQLLVKHVGMEHKDVLELEKKIVEIEFRKGNYNSAIEMYEILIKKMRSIVGCSEPECLTLEFQIGRALRYQGKYKKSLLHVEKAIEKRKQLVGTEDTEYFDGLSNQVSVLTYIGDYETALKVSETVLENYEKILGKESEKALNFTQDIAKIYGEMGDAAKAVSILTEIYKKTSATLGNEHRQTLKCGHYLALYLTRNGQHPESLDLFTKTLEVRKKFGGVDHPRTISSQEAMAEVLINMSEYNEALSLLRHVHQNYVDNYGKDNPKTMICQRNIASALLGLGSWDEALNILSGIAEGLEADLGQKHIEVCKLKLETAKVLEKKQNFEGSLKILKELETGGNNVIRSHSVFLAAATIAERISSQLEMPELN